MPFVVEATKPDHPKRIIPWSLVAACVLLGLSWNYLFERSLFLQTKAAQLTSDPTTWFVIITATFFVLRSRTKTQPQSGAVDEEKIREISNSIISKHLDKLNKINEEIVENNRKINIRIKDISENILNIEEKLNNFSIIEKYKESPEIIEKFVYHFKDKIKELHKSAKRAEGENVMDPMQHWDNGQQNIWNEFDPIDRETSKLGWEETRRNQHPNYNLNPMKPVPGDENIKDPELKQEYRRVHDMMRNAADEALRKAATAKGDRERARNSIINE